MLFWEIEKKGVCSEIQQAAGLPNFNDECLSDKQATIIIQTLNKSESGTIIKQTYYRNNPVTQDIFSDKFWDAT